MVKATLGTAGWWNSDLLFTLISASELWILNPSKANTYVNKIFRRLETEVTDVSHFITMMYVSEDAFPNHY